MSICKPFYPGTALVKRAQNIITMDHLSFSIFDISDDLAGLGQVPSTIVVDKDGKYGKPIDCYILLPIDQFSKISDIKANVSSILDYMRNDKDNYIIAIEIINVNKYEDIIKDLEELGFKNFNFYCQSAFTTPMVYYNDMAKAYFNQAQAEVNDFNRIKALLKGYDSNKEGEN